VTATPAQLSQTVHEFLNGGIANGHIQLPAPSTHSRRRALPPIPLSSATSSELAQAQALAKNIPLPLYFPARRVTTAAAPADDIRSYFLPDRSHHVHYAYVDVIGEGQIGQYYDLEGTDWSHPAIIANPNQTLVLGGRKFALFFEGQRLRIVSWRQGTAVYWLINTLQNILTNHQMLAIAQSAQVVH
jgi:hypothetical protein